MAAFKSTFRLLRRCLTGLLVGYWLVFFFYTAEKFVTGGSSAVVSWYKHVGISLTHQGDAWVLSPWSWGIFVSRQFALFGVTLALCLMEYRSKRSATLHHRP